MINLDSIICPGRFNVIVEATKALAYTKENPALTLGKYMGHLLAKIAVIKIGKEIKEKDEFRRKDAEDFQILLQSEWHCRVNAFGVEKRIKNNRKTVKTIPLTDDLLKLRKFLRANIELSMKNLQQEVDQKEWSCPAKFCLVRRILFNKRRRAEVKEVMVKAYAESSDWKKDTNKEMELSLTPESKILANR